MTYAVLDFSGRYNGSLHKTTGRIPVFSDIDVCREYVTKLSERYPQKCLAILEVKEWTQHGTWEACQ